KIAGVLDGGPTQVGVESTVVDCTGEKPIILRLGKITAEDIKKVLQMNPVSVYEEEVEKPKSPGLKYKHYAPEIPLYLVTSTKNIQTIIEQKRKKGYRVGALVSDQTVEQISADKIISIGENEEEMATNLYHALRSFKKNEIDLII